MILLDTNVISELMLVSPNHAVLAWLDQQLDEDLYLCVITKAEIEWGISLLPEGKRKLRLTKAAAEVLAAFKGRCLVYDCEATPYYIAVANCSRTSGRPMSVEDMLIAAIAMANNCILATRNVTDFDFLPDLELINPWAEITEINEGRID